MNRSLISIINRIAGCLIIFLVDGCSPSIINVPHNSVSREPFLEGPVAPLTQNDTAMLENEDRIKRFQRLSHNYSIEAPLVEQVFAPAGISREINGPVPVVRIIFDERVFFDSDSSIPLPESTPILDVIARNMKQDVPDAALTVLGHTDSTGEPAYNVRLSDLRALHVMKLLIDRGTDPLQMTSVAIGDRQPIATNATPEGRSRNRRVEFLISASPEANLAVVQHRTVNPEWLSTRGVNVSAGEQVTVYQSRLVESSGIRKTGLMPVGQMELAAPESVTVNPSGIDSIDKRPLAPPPAVDLRPAEQIIAAPLTDMIVDPN